MARGRFITFEGGEGCGKSTQIRRLKASLEELGVDVVLVREPGGTWLCEEIRALIKDQIKESPSVRSELLLFLAARAQLVNSVIEPQLAAGKWVVSDRFSDSTAAYQGYARALPLDFITAANDFACAGLKPDITFLLDVSPEAALARRHHREEDQCEPSDRFERENTAFHDAVRRGFEALAKSNPERIVTIDGEGAEEVVADRILEECKRRLF